MAIDYTKITANPKDPTKWGVTPEELLSGGYNYGTDYKAIQDVLSVNSPYAPVIGTLRGQKMNSNQNMFDEWGITDADKNAQLSALNQLNTQQQNQPVPGYANPYKSYIDETIASIKNRGDFNYDASQDQALQQAQDYTSKNVYETIQRQNARRGMQSDAWNMNNAGQSATEAAMALIPQFRNQALQEYTSNYGKDIGTLSALTGEDQRNIENVFSTSDRLGSLGGIDTVQGKSLQISLSDSEWAKSKNNPQNQLDVLMVAQQELLNKALPEQLKTQLKLEKQAFEKGEIDIEAYRKSLKQIDADYAQTLATTSQIKQSTASSAINDMLSIQQSGPSIANIKADTNYKELQNKLTESGFNDWMDILNSLSASDREAILEQMKSLNEEE